MYELVGGSNPSYAFLFGGEGSSPSSCIFFSSTNGESPLLFGFTRPTGVRIKLNGSSPFDVEPFYWMVG